MAVLWERVKPECWSCSLYSAEDLRPCAPGGALWGREHQEPLAAGAGRRPRPTPHSYLIRKGHMMVDFGCCIITISSLLRPGGSFTLGPQACVNVAPSVHAGEQPNHIREETTLAILMLLRHHHVALLLRHHQAALLLRHHHTALLQRGARPPLGVRPGWPAWPVVPPDGEWAGRHLARYDHCLAMGFSEGPGAALTAALHRGTLARTHGALALVSIVEVEVVVGAKLVVVHTVPRHGGAAGAAAPLPPDGKGTVAHAIATHPADVVLVPTDSLEANGRLLATPP